MILGIDISTSIIGWCLLENDSSYFDIGHLDLKKQKSFYGKLDLFIGDIINNVCKDKDLKIYIEAPLQRSNNINVVNLLQRWNASCCTSIYIKLNIEPYLIEQRTALKSLGIKIPKGVKGKDRKKYILDCVKEYGIIPHNKWENKKTGNPKDFCYDQADAYIIAAASLKINTEQ